MDAVPCGCVCVVQTAAYTAALCVKEGRASDFADAAAELARLTEEIGREKVQAEVFAERAAQMAAEVEKTRTNNLRQQRMAAQRQRDEARP